MPTFDYSGIAGGTDVHTCAVRARIEDSERKSEGPLGPARGLSLSCPSIPDHGYPNLLRLPKYAATKSASAASR